MNEALKTWNRTRFIKGGLTKQDMNDTWRSICFGMKFVKDGVRWSVGDGQKIRVLTDNWIPNFKPAELRLLTPISDGATVSFLLNKDGSAWDADIVCFIF